MCPLPPLSPGACYLPLVSPPPPLVPRVPHPKFVPRGVGAGRGVCWVSRAQVPDWAAWSAMRWRRAGGGPASARTVTVTPGWAFNLCSVERLLRASRPCDVRRRALLARLSLRRVILGPLRTTFDHHHRLKLALQRLGSPSRLISGTKSRCAGSARSSAYETHDHPLHLCGSRFCGSASSGASASMKIVT